MILARAHPLLWGVLLSFLASSTFAAEVTTRTVQAVALEPGRAKAIEAALVEAVSKVTGVKLDAMTATELGSLEITKKGKSSFSSREEYISRVQKTTKGLVSSWEVTSEGRSTDGLYRVELDVTIATVVLEPREGRKSLLILPFQVVGECSTPAGKLTPDSLAVGFRQGLVAYLASSRKFAVLDETFAGELSRVGESDTDLETGLQTLIRRASRLRADYLVVGSCESFAIAQNTVQVGTTTSTVTRPSGLVSIRVIRVDSGQTVLAVNQLLNQFVKVKFGGATPHLALVDWVCRQFSDRILDTIYPIRVAELVDGEVAIDRGGETVLEGQQFEVFAVGDTIMDSATGEKLGAVEKSVGRIEIVRVLPKVSYGRRLAGGATIAVGSICRRPAEPTATGVKQSNGNESAVDDLFK